MNEYLLPGFLNDYNSTNTLEQQLTENIIKRVALRFFRHHYKFRLRYEDQPVIAKFDLQGAGGILADGFYSFKKADGKTFVATFEATSKESRQEVLFKPQQKILFWDGLAIASLVALLFFTVNTFQPFHQLDERTFFSRLGLVLLVIGFVMGVFALIAQQFRRYRYIYAVEQFKKYNADEQWVALAHDVFDHSDDRYFKELKEQCVYNGFGLLLIDKNLDPRIIITPSRQDIFLGRRRMVEFFSGGKLSEAVRKTRYGNWWTMFRSQLPELFIQDNSLLRHRKSYLHQMAITCIALTLMGFIFTNELKKAGFRTVEREEFTQNMARSRSNNVPEQRNYIGDSSSMPKSKPSKEKFWQLEKEKDEKEKVKDEESPLIAEAEPKKNGDEEIFISRGGEEFLAYDCSRFYTFDTTKFVVTEGIYGTWTHTKERLNVLQNSGVEAAALRLACFKKNVPGYMVYVGLIYNSVEEANSEIEKLKLSPKTALGKWKVKALEPVQ